VKMYQNTAADATGFFSFAVFLIASRHRPAGGRVSPRAVAFRATRDIQAGVRSENDCREKR